MVYVYGVPQWRAPEIEVFWSEDLQNWSSQRALSLPGWGIYNTSVCHVEGRWLMSFEVDEPKDVVGIRFTIFFAESADGLNWRPLPHTHVYDREKYSACPVLRYLDEYFYIIYLESIDREHQDTAYASFIVRSQDLIHWESCPYNPIMEFSDEDRRITNANLNAEERQRIATAYNRNNSDVDLCEFNSDVVIIIRGATNLASNTWQKQSTIARLRASCGGFPPNSGPIPDGRLRTRSGATAGGSHPHGRHQCRNDQPAYWPARDLAYHHYWRAADLFDLLAGI